MSLELLKSHLQNFGEGIGLNDLAFNEEGICSLLIDDCITITLECNEDLGALFFSACVGTVPSYKAASFYPKLLAANLFWLETGGGTLGVHPETLEVFLSYQESLEEMDFPSFEELFMRFKRAALDWNSRLEKDILCE